MRRSISISRLRPRLGLRRLRVLGARRNAGTLAPPVQVLLILRWSARLASLLVLATLVALTLGTRIEVASLQPVEWILMLFLLWTGVGMILGWRWEIRGGSLSLAGVVGFHLIEWGASGNPPRGWAFPTLALPGLLFLAAGLLARHRGSETST